MDLYGTAKRAGKKVLGLIQGMAEEMHGHQPQPAASGQAATAPKAAAKAPDEPAALPPVKVEPGKGPMLSSFRPEPGLAGKALAGAFALHVASEISQGGGKEKAWRSFFAQVAERGADGPGEIARSAWNISKNYDAFAKTAMTPEARSGAAEPPARTASAEAAEAKPRWRGYSREEAEDWQHSPEER